MRAGLLALALLAGCRLEPAEPPPVAPVPVEAPPADEAPPPDALRPEAPAPPPPPGGLLIPVVGVAPADLVDTFSAARGEGRSHDAIDIPAPRGTPVVAAAAGTVARIFESDAGGLTVYQLGADRRTVYYYAHLDAYADGLAEGDRLRPGDPVGTVGDSGNAPEGVTHLHFAIWTTDDPADVWDGPPVNPYPLLGGE